MAADSPLLTPERAPLDPGDEAALRRAHNGGHLVDWSRKDLVRTIGALLAALDLARERERKIAEAVRMLFTAEAAYIHAPPGCGDESTLAFARQTLRALVGGAPASGQRRHQEREHAVGDTWAWGRAPWRATVVHVNGGRLHFRHDADGWISTAAEMAESGWTRLPRAGGEGGA